MWISGLRWHLDIWHVGRYIPQHINCMLVGLCRPEYGIRNCVSPRRRQRNLGYVGFPLFKCSLEKTHVPRVPTCILEGRVRIYILFIHAARRRHEDTFLNSSGAILCDTKLCYLQTTGTFLSTHWHGAICINMGFSCILTTKLFDSKNFDAGKSYFSNGWNILGTIS